MKKSLLLMAVLAFTGAGAFEFELENKTPMAIVKIDTENDARKSLRIPAGSTQKVTLPDDNSDDDFAILTLDSGKELAVEEELGTLQKVTVEFPEFFSTRIKSRQSFPDYPMGQVRIKTPRQVTAVYIAPLSDPENWQLCQPKDAKKGFYDLPVKTLYRIKFQTKVKSKPEYIIDRKGKGYDFSDAVSFSVSFEEFRITVKKK